MIKKFDLCYNLYIICKYFFLAEPQLEPWPARVSGSGPGRTCGYLAKQGKQTQNSL